MASTEQPELSSTRQSPRKLMIYPFSPMGAEATPHGAKQSPWPNSASATIRHQPSSPYSSTPPKPPHPTEQAGVVLEAGPRIGRDALEAILCDAVTEVTARSEDGTPMVYGRRTKDHPTRPTPGHHPPRRQHLHRRRLSQHPPTPESTTSSPGQKAEQQTPKISSPCAGSTIRSSSTNEASSPTTIPDHGRIRFRKPALRGPPSG